MAPTRNLALYGAVTAIVFAAILSVCVVFSPSLDSAVLLASTATQGKGDQRNFFATLAPGGSIHKLAVASGNSALAKAEKKLSSYAYPKFPTFARSPKAGPLAPKMSLSDIEHTLQTDAADLLKDAGPSHAAVEINTPRPVVATSKPRKQSVASSAALGGLATQSNFPVGSPFPAKGARVIYIGGGAEPSQASERAQQQLNEQRSVVYVGGNSPSPSNSLVGTRARAADHAAIGYDPYEVALRLPQRLFVTFATGTCRLKGKCWMSLQSARKDWGGTSTIQLLLTCSSGALRIASRLLETSITGNRLGRTMKIKTTRDFPKVSAALRCDKNSSKFRLKSVPTVA